MTFSYKTAGTCSRRIDIELDGSTVKSISFEGGCSGNLKGISGLVKGMEIDEVIEKLGGITCGFKSTSCPDQLARALAKYKEENDI